MQRGISYAALSALTLAAGIAQAQGFGPDTATPAIPADSGTAVSITPLNNGTTTYSPANNPGQAAPAGPSRAVVITNAPPPNADGSKSDQSSFGTSGVLPDDNTGPIEVPDIHLVRRGDTLWDLCNRYYQNPWAWPKVWSYNSQIANPHWIYPGDQVRITSATGGGGQKALSLGPTSATLGTNRTLRANRKNIVPGTVFMMDQGYIGDPKRDVWGELVGSDEEQMMLSEGNHAVLMMRPGVTVSKGQELTVFSSVRQPEKVANSRRPPGEIVAIRGTVKVIDFNPDTRMARAILTESTDVIERGALIGPLGRRYDVVPPLKTNDKISTRVLTSVYPNVYIAKDQVAFLDKGSEDGLVPGNRLFVVRRGDTWRSSLVTAASNTRKRMLINTPEQAGYEDTPTRGDANKFPEDTIAELRILRTEKFSSIALVVASKREVVGGDLAVTRPGE
jgi:hypothetical protein